MHAIRESIFWSSLLHQWKRNDEDAKLQLV
jgi:hypothetical protein